MDKNENLEAKEETKSKQNKIALCVFIIGVIIILGIVTGTIIIKNNKDYNNNKNELNNIKNFENKSKKNILDGYEELEITETSLSNRIQLNDFNDVEIDDEEGIGLIKIDSQRNNVKLYDSSLVLDSGILYFTTEENDKIELQFKDVVTCYVQYHECSGTNLYIVTNDNKIYSTNIHGLDDVEGVTNVSPDELLVGTFNNNIINLQELFTNEATCGYKSDIIVTINNNEKYTLNGHKYNYVYKIMGNSNNKKIAYVNENRQVEIDNKIINYKFKFGFSKTKNIDDESGYFVTTSYNLFSVDENKLVNDSKIVKVYKNNSIPINYRVIFENGDIFNFEFEDVNQFWDEE